MCNQFVNHGKESLDKENRGAGRARYSSVNELLLEYVESDGGPVWSVKRRAKQDVWLGWMSAILNLDSVKKDEVLISNSRGRFWSTGRDSLQLCGHNDFDVMAPVVYPGFFMVVIGGDGSSTWACPESYKFFYFSTVV